MDQFKKITLWLGFILLICICLLLGQCGRSSEFEKKYRDIKSELDAAIDNNTKLVQQLDSGTREIERLAKIAAAEHGRIVQLEKIAGEQGKINSELEKYFDGNAIALDDAKRAIAASRKAVEEIEKYYNK